MGHILALEKVHLSDLNPTLKLAVSTSRSCSLLVIAPNLRLTGHAPRSDQSPLFAHSYSSLEEISLVTNLSVFVVLITQTSYISSTTHLGRQGSTSMSHTSCEKCFVLCGMILWITSESSSDLHVWKVVTLSGISFDVGSRSETR